MGKCMHAFIFCWGYLTSILILQCADIYINAVLSTLFLVVLPVFSHLLLLIYLWYVYFWVSNTWYWYSSSPYFWKANSSGTLSLWFASIYSFTRLLLSGFLCYGRIHAASDFILLEPFWGKSSCCACVFILSIVWGLLPIFTLCHAILAPVFFGNDVLITIRCLYVT
jgi:hypothetical protein